MTPAPAIYGELDEVQLAAYQRWVDALLERSDHGLGCRACAGAPELCPVGAQLREHELRVWQAWRSALSGGGSVRW